MEIAVLGGTGDLGRGLAQRWASDAGHDVVIGSRDADRAATAADAALEAVRAADEAMGAAGEAADGEPGAPADAVGTASIEGRENVAAAATADVVVVAVPPEHLAATVERVADALREDAIVVSPAIGLAFDGAGAHYDPPNGRGSAPSYAALAAAAAPDGVPVVGAFHTVSASRLQDLEAPLDVDTLVVGDDAAARATVAGLAEAVEGLRALDAGPLANASKVERLGPLLITLGRYNDGEDYGLYLR